MVTGHRSLVSVTECQKPFPTAPHVAPGACDSFASSTVAMDLFFDSPVSKCPGLNHVIFRTHTYYDADGWQAMTSLFGALRSIGFAHGTLSYLDMGSVPASSGH